jgi:hypothetical protein
MFTRELGAHRRRAARTCALACVPAIALAASGCGGTTAKGDPQDADETSGNFPVEVTDVSFPLKQTLAESATMKIAVRNAGDRVIPNIAVTVQCDDTKNGQNGSFDRQIAGQGNADKNRPIFVVDEIPGPKRPQGGQQLDPLERSTAYVNTYTLGPLAANRAATFEWKVTAVHAGPFRVCYRIAAGLDGKAIAKQEGGKPIADELNGDISNKAPKTGVADDGKTITTLPETSGQ